MCDHLAVSMGIERFRDMVARIDRPIFISSPLDHRWQISLLPGLYPSISSTNSPTRPQHPRIRALPPCDGLLFTPKSGATQFRPITFIPQRPTWIRAKHIREKSHFKLPFD